MAKQVEGFMGGFSGRLGPVVGYCWRGRWCMRAAPQAVKNPRTAAQQSHRMAFRQMVQLSSAMHDALRIGMRAESFEMGMTECNLFARLNKDFVSENSIDFPMLRISCGPVAPVGFGAPVIDSDNILTVNYERNPLHIAADNLDSVYLYLYCPEAGSGMLSAPSNRASRRISVALPDEWSGLTIHIYGFVINYRGWASESVYMSLDESDTAENVHDGIVENLEEASIYGSSPKLGRGMPVRGMSVTFRARSCEEAEPLRGAGDRREAVVEECVGETRNTLLSQRQAAASSPILGEQP